MSKFQEIRGWATGSRTRVLLYHSISDALDDPFAIPEQNFQQQMSWLSQEAYQVISHSQYILHLSQRQSLKRTLVITFDDGLANFAHTAVPILARYHFPAIIFIPTAKIGGVRDWNKKLSGMPLLSQRQIEQLLTLGFEIGSHSARHADLRQLNDLDLRRELTESFEYIRTLPGSQFPSLAYPYGRASLREQQAAREAGFTSAYLAGGLWGNGKPCNPFALTRLPVNRDTTMKQFARLVRGSADLINLFTVFNHSKRGAD